jgi:nucleoid-associated protein YgaU
MQLGRVAVAQKILADLESQVSGSRPYVVRTNERLADISARSDVYGNRYLWPLLWRANQNQLRKPEDLHSGMQLQVPSYPTVSEVADALDYSHSNPLPR